MLNKQNPHRHTKLGKKYVLYSVERGVYLNHGVFAFDANRRGPHGKPIEQALAFDSLVHMNNHFHGIYDAVQWAELDDRWKRGDARLVEVLPKGKFYVTEDECADHGLPRWTSGPRAAAGSA